MSLAEDKFRATAWYQRSSAQRQEYGYDDGHRQSKVIHHDQTSMNAHIRAFS